MTGLCALQRLLLQLLLGERVREHIINKAPPDVATTASGLSFLLIGLSFDGQEHS